MRQVDFLRLLATENGYEVKELTQVWEKAMSLIKRQLTEGIPVHTTIGEFFPSLFLASEDAPDENGEGPLVRAADRGRDRVIPTFQFDTRFKRSVTDYAPITQELREINAIRTARFFREKKYKEAVFKRKKAGS